MLYLFKSDISYWNMLLFENIVLEKRKKKWHHYSNLLSFLNIDTDLYRYWWKLYQKIYNFSVLQYIAMIIYNTWLFTPEILDVLLPMNESRPRMQPFKAEFFVDEEEYFYLIRSHTCIVIFMLPLTFLATSTLFVALAQHACGMCELLG